jgi:hypothetical protein
MHVFDVFVRGLPVLGMFVGRGRWLGFFKGCGSCLIDMGCVEVCLLNLLNSVVVDMEISSLFFWYWFNLGLYSANSSGLVKGTNFCLVCDSIS